MRPLIGLLLIVSAGVPAPAQTPGPASFRVYERGVRVGTIEMTLERLDDGWRLAGSSRIGGSVTIDLPRLELQYGPDWRGRFMSLDLRAPEELLVHVAVVGATTRTDVTRGDRVRFRANSVSPDTIFLPDHAFGAYEAVAARLTGAVPGTDLPLFIAPEAEIRVLVEAVTPQRVRTATGTLEVRRYHLLEWRGGPTPVEVWAHEGRLVRLDVPRRQITVLRDDLR